MATKNQILRFDFTPASDAQRLLDGYGAGVLHLDNRPFWFSKSADDPQPVDWTWIDFLEHLGAIWPALIAEQTYPFEWLNKSASHPGEIWTRAESRWTRLGDAVADQEEPALYEFHCRHNLAAGWKGIGLPALFWLRVGNSVWLSPEEGAPLRVNYQECRDSLLAIGDQLAETFTNSENPRVISAIQAWRSRGAALKACFLELTTGLTKKELHQIEAGTLPNNYWDISEATDWSRDSANDSEFLVAARMTKGILGAPAIAKIIAKIRGSRKTKSASLDKLSYAAISHLQPGRYSFPHESAYHLAEWVRKQFHFDETKYFDIKAVLVEELKVEVTNAQFGSDHIDAIAFWGSHGPCIMLNDDRAWANDEQRLRMTLAHELCHLLVDRKNALTAVEVLGGSVDLYIERRANAFAAELLLPRASIEWARSRCAPSLRDLQQFLCQEFSVSKLVTCAQIYNSTVFSSLQRTEQDYIERRLSKSVQFILPEKVVSEIV